MQYSTETRKQIMETSLRANDESLVAHQELAKVRQNAKTLGPSYIDGLNEPYRSDPFVQKLIALADGPKHLQPWSIEYQVGRLITAAYSAANGGESLEVSWNKTDAVRLLAKKGWPPYKSNYALEFAKAALEKNSPKDTAAFIAETMKVADEWEQRNRTDLNGG